MTLGPFDKAPLFDAKIVLAPGDSLVFYTEVSPKPSDRGSNAAPPGGLYRARHLSEYRDGLPRDDTAILVVQVPESPEPPDPT